MLAEFKWKVKCPIGENCLTPNTAFLFNILAWDLDDMLQDDGPETLSLSFFITRHILHFSVESFTVQGLFPKGRSLVVSDPATMVAKAPLKWPCCLKLHILSSTLHIVPVRLLCPSWSYYWVLWASFKWITLYNSATTVKSRYLQTRGMSLPTKAVFKWHSDILGSFRFPSTAHRSHGLTIIRLVPAQLACSKSKPYILLWKSKHSKPFCARTGMGYGLSTSYYLQLIQMHVNITS